MVGFGYDLHRLSEGNKLILGGIEIESQIGVIAHSDGDVLLHSIIDAILGAIGEGDIGEHFPDTDIENKGIDSKIMLEKALELLTKNKCELINVDVTIVLEKPKLSPYKKEIKVNIAKLLNLPDKRVNIKATTNEKMGAVGSEEAIIVYAVCELREF